MNWDPFLLAEPGSKPDAPRSLDPFEGMGDRLRSAALNLKTSKEPGSF
jgi:hypothetical protein